MKNTQLAICLLAFICAGCAGHVKGAEKQTLTARGHVNLVYPDGKKSVYIYRVEVENHTDHAICIAEKSMPYSVAFRASGWTVQTPGQSLDREGPDLGDPTQSELDRSTYSVQVVLPRKSIVGNYKISDFFDMSEEGDYAFKQKIYYVDCGKLYAFSNLDLAGDWSTIGENIVVASHIHVEKPLNKQ